MRVCKFYIASRTIIIRFTITEITIGFDISRLSQDISLLFLREPHGISVALSQTVAELFLQSSCDFGELSKLAFRADSN